MNNNCKNNDDDDMIKIKKSVIIPGSGIKIQKLCKSQYLISSSANGCKTNGSFIIANYSGTVQVPVSSPKTEIKSIILTQNTVNNIFIELAALAVDGTSTFEQYDITYSYIANVQLAGSYYLVYTGDFELPIEITSIGSQLSIAVVNIGQNITVKYNMTVKTASFP